MTSRGPAARIHAVLSVVRPHVDEIVLGVDRKGDPEVVDTCAELADRVMRYEYAPPPCRMIGWLLDQCSCDWTLRFDDDEIPSRALLDALPDLISDRRPLDFGLPPRWLHGAPDTYLLSPPWQPDYQ